MSKDLFMMVMEAEGDLLQPFDAGAPDEGAAPNEADAQSSPPENSGFDEPPPLSEDEDLQFSDSDGGDGMDDSGNEDDNAEEKKDDGKLSEKANNILNQQLYQTMLERNSEIEEIINNIQTIVPLLPYEVVKVNDESLNNLKTALAKGQKYVISDFIDAKYGENLLFYEKLNALYTLLLNNIDANLKKIEQE